MSGALKVSLIEQAVVNPPEGMPDGARMYRIEYGGHAEACVAEGLVWLPKNADRDEFERHLQDLWAASEKCPARRIFEEWNRMAKECGVHAARGLTEKRRAKLRARWKDERFRSGYRAALERVRRSRFCCGKNDRGWKANFDWFVRDDTTWLKLVEGRYDFANEREGKGDALAKANWRELKEARDRRRANG